MSLGLLFYLSLYRHWCIKFHIVIFFWFFIKKENQYMKIFPFWLKCFSPKLRTAPLKSSLKFPVTCRHPTTVLLNRSIGINVFDILNILCADKILVLSELREQFQDVGKYPESLRGKSEEWRVLGYSTDGQQLVYPKETLDDISVWEREASELGRPGHARGTWDKDQKPTSTDRPGGVGRLLSRQHQLFSRRINLPTRCFSALYLLPSTV